jgi:GR25 family glycosyltransferase involved in LPS biosynthesis
MAQRLKNFRQHSHAFEELPRLQEFPATDGRTLDVAHDERISVQARLRMAEGSGRRSHSDLQTPGMAGLYISHVEVWKAILASGEPVGIVLEDDAVVSLGTAERMLALQQGMPEPGSWDVWLLGTVAIMGRGQPPAGFPGAEAGAGSSSGAGWIGVTEWWGTQAYAVSRRGAAALLAHAYPMDVQVDAFMAQMAAMGEITVVSRASTADLDIPQFAWWQQTTTLQKFELMCDVCDLPNDFSVAQDTAGLATRGLLLGAAAVLAAPTALRWLQAAAALLLPARCSALLQRRSLRPE